MKLTSDMASYTRSAKFAIETREFRLANPFNVNILSVNLQVGLWRIRVYYLLYNGTTHKRRLTEIVRLQTSACRYLYM